MIIVNPQWQGIGRPNPVPQGAEFIAGLLREKGFEFKSMPLDQRELILSDNVRGLDQITDLVLAAHDTIQAESPSRIFTCGGDCTSDFAQLAYLNNKYDGDMALIWVDAHADLNTPESSPSQNFHGMPLRTLMGEGPKELLPFVKRPLRPGQLTFFGLRSLDPEEIRFIEEEHIRVFKTEDVRALDRKYPHLTSGNVYLHVDIDSLDQSVFNDCATPTSGGFELDELLALIQHYVKNYNIVGGCMTEYGPKEAGASGDIVRKILFEGFNIEKHYAEYLAQ